MPPHQAFHAFRADPDATRANQVATYQSPANPRAMQLVVVPHNSVMQSAGALIGASGATGPTRGPDEVGGVDAGGSLHAYTEASK